MMLLAQARAAGLVVRLCGARFRVDGMEQLAPEMAESWRIRFRACRDEVFTDRRALLQHLGVGRRGGVRLLAERYRRRRRSALTSKPCRSRASKSAPIAWRVSGSKRPDARKHCGVLARSLRHEPSSKLRPSPASRMNEPKTPVSIRTDHRSAFCKFMAVAPGPAVLDMARLPWAVTSPLWERPLVAHNAEFELKHLAARGIEPVRIECTMQAAGLMLGVHRRGLKDAAFHYLDVELSKELQGSDWSAPQLSSPQIHYAGLDAVLTFRLASKVLPALHERRAAYVIQRDVLPAVARMELRGVGFDIEANRDLITALTAARGELAQAFPKACEDIGRPDLGRELPQKPNDQRRLLEALLSHEERASWPLTPKRTGLSIRRSDLRRAAHHHPIELLTRISALDKALTSANRLAAHVSPVTGRLHADYNVAGARSGRARCSSPSLQNVPRDPRFRSLFVASPGWRLVAGDWSAMELRAAAQISGDAALSTLFERGDDPHRLMAAALNGIEPSAVTPAQRQAAKPVNFGAIYGMGAQGLQQYAWDSYDLVLTKSEAQRQLDTFERQFRQLSQWRRRHAELCRGRRSIRIGAEAAKGIGRVYEFSWNTDPAKRQFDYPQACNLPIQGACADAAMLALTAIDAGLRRAGIAGGPVLVVHDEIVIEVPEADAPEAATLLQKAMTEAFAATFPGALYLNRLAYD